jgi:hypothetical protein
VGLVRQFHEAQTAANLGKIETAIEILESIRVKSLLPGKGPRKGFENLLAETEEALGEHACTMSRAHCVSPTRDTLDVDWTAISCKVTHANDTIN